MKFDYVIFGLQSCYPTDAEVVWLQLSYAVKHLFIHLTYYTSLS